MGKEKGVGNKGRVEMDHRSYFSKFSYSKFHFETETNILIGNDIKVIKFGMDFYNIHQCVV